MSRAWRRRIGAACTCRDYRATASPRSAAQFAADAEFPLGSTSRTTPTRSAIPTSTISPTLLIADAQALRFFGRADVPQAQTAERLVRQALDGALTQGGDEALVERVRAAVRES